MDRTCLTSNLPINAPQPKPQTNETASSKEEYLTENLSGGMSSLMDDPLGDDKSKIILYVPSFLGTAPTAPRGEQCKLGSGMVGNGPDVCLRCSSLMIADVTDSGLLHVVNKCFGKPKVKPYNIYWTLSQSGWWDKSDCNPLTFTGELKERGWNYWAFGLNVDGHDNLAWSL